MNKVIILITIIVAATTISFGQNTDGEFQTSPNGLDYRFIKKGTGEPAQIGDSITFNLVSKIGDSLLFDNRRNGKGKPVKFQVKQIAIRGDLAEAFAMMGEGDVAEFKISVDTLMNQGQELLGWVQRSKGLKLEYHIELLTIKSQSKTDDRLLQEYFKKKNLKPTKTESGLYYAITKKGTGAMPGPGDSVTVNYTGKLMDGKSFDSNTDPKFQHVEPLSFVLGKHQVISGWDEGIALLPKGSKGFLYIPSALGYGPDGRDDVIPANGILIFDMELLDVKKGK